MSRTTDVAAFWNRTAQGYARKPIKDETAYRHKLDATQRHLRSDMEVLEFGCGTGSTALIHAPRVRSILAIDVSSAMIEIAKGKAREAGVSNVTFEVAAFEDLQAREGSFDAVLGLSILHLLPNLDEALLKLHRLLRPGGYFFSSTVCVKDMGRIANLILPVAAALRLAPPVNAFTARQLTARLESAGFAIDYSWRPGPGKAVFIVARKPMPNNAL